MTRRLGTLLLGAAAFGAAGCGPPGPAPLPAFGPAARVVVTLNDGRDSLPAITDSARIRAIGDFVRARATGWEAPRLPLSWRPAPRVWAVFYRAAADRGAAAAVGAGPGFLEVTGRPDYLATRRASDVEVAEFLRLVGAPSDAAATEVR